MDEKALLAWTESVQNTLNGYRKELDLIHQINEQYTELFKEIINVLKEIKEKENQIGDISNLS